MFACDRQCITRAQRWKSYKNNWIDGEFYCLVSINNKFNYIGFFRHCLELELNSTRFVLGKCQFSESIILLTHNMRSMQFRMISKLVTIFYVCLTCICFVYFVDIKHWDKHETKWKCNNCICECRNILR